ncbi:hypothetical protein [Microcoleus sp. bin38.metabat.b11b12b14.051]|nr:hypothetical protein [Microcoleus sp. bin38.metabat.b11b12b14.051]
MVQNYQWLDRSSIRYELFLSVARSRSGECDAFSLGDRRVVRYFPLLNKY